MLVPGNRLRERYRIIREIGGGGFGYVYEAVDEVFGCSVALKETKEAVAGTDKLRKAFEREAKLLRSLKHASLPRVTDYFFQDGAQFLVMDFIDGHDLAALLKEHFKQHQQPFSCEEAVPWADKVLDALEYLHSRPEQIIHRDIKPANIKLTTDGGIYLLDFGLAKGTVGQMSTMVEGQTSSSISGFTREYAPLEQVQDTGTTPQSDLYSVGATLYHLLTGQLPLSASQRDEAIHQGRGDPLRRAHEVNPAIPQSISAIISQALEVRWWDRIATATEMRAALRQACQETANTIPASNQQAGNEASNTKSPTATIPANQQQPANQFAALNSKPSTLPLHPSPVVIPRLNLEPPAQYQRPTSLSRRRTLLALGLGALMLAGIVALAFYKFFGKAVIANNNSSSNRTVRIPTPAPAINAAQKVKATPSTLSLKQELTEHAETIWAIAFSPDGSLMASGGGNNKIVLWDTKTWKPKYTLPGHTGEVYSVTFSPDSRLLASGGSDGAVKIWDTQTGQLAPPPQPPIVYKGGVLRVAFSPDGNLLASAGTDIPIPADDTRLKDVLTENSLMQWDVVNGWLSKPLADHQKIVLAIAFSPDGKTLASTGYDGRVVLRNLQTGARDTKFKDDELTFTSLAFSPDGKYLVCGGGDGKIKRWQRQNGVWHLSEPLKVSEPGKERTDWVRSLAISPDSKFLVSASKDDRILLWDIQAGTSKSLSDAPLKTRTVAFSPDGQTLVSGGEDKIIRVWQ